jgi:hypothetical protein
VVVALRGHLCKSFVGLFECTTPIISVLGNFDADEEAVGEGCG